ncbi:hypothetical protein [Kitasatospora sp. NPDC059599]|uniref:hypothetical protein n=1 Tax=Kitasatospora sp. NPDC059599 TaxID=3346880 RepID=UPI0036B77C43
MDSGVRAMVEAVGEAQRQLRENALPKVRENRDRVAETEEAALLAALAGLVDAAGELAEGLVDRIDTPDTRKVYLWAGKRLREQAGHLRNDERQVSAGVKPAGPAKTP